MAYSGNWPTFLSFDADIQGHKMFPLKKNLKTTEVVVPTRTQQMKKM